MSFISTLPKNWIDLQIENKLLFINPIENLITYHPPMDIKNLGAFLKLYKINLNKEEIINLLQKVTHATTNSATKKLEFQKLTMPNGLSIENTDSSQLLIDQNLQTSKIIKPQFDQTPIINGK